MKRIFTALLIATVLLCLPSCNLSHIEDTNGDSTALCHFTDADITSSRTNSYLAVGTVTSSHGDYASFRTRKFSGIKEISRRSVNDGSLTVAVASGISSGNARIVLVSDGRIVADFNVNGFTEYTVDKPVGVYSLLVVGESAELECEVDWTVK